MFTKFLGATLLTPPTPLRGTFKSKAPLRVQFSPALGGGGGGKGLKPKLLLGFTK